MNAVSGKDLKIKESIKVAEITWSKFTEDEYGNAWHVTPMQAFMSFVRLRMIL